MERVSDTTWVGFNAMTEPLETIRAIIEAEARSLAPYGAQRTQDMLRELLLPAREWS